MNRYCSKAMFCVYVLLWGMAGIAFGTDASSVEISESSFDELIRELRLQPQDLEPYPEKGVTSRTKEEHESYVHQVRMTQRTARERSEAAWQKIVELGDIAIPRIVRILESQHCSTGSRCYRLTNALAAMGTEEAKRVLREMAFAEDPANSLSSHRRHAAAHYLEWIGNKKPEDTLALLHVAPHPALQGLRGTRTAEKTIAFARSQISRSDMLWLNNIASLFASDPSDSFANERVEIVLAYLKELESRPKNVRQQQIIVTANNIHQDRRGQFTRALQDIKGGEVVLRNALSETTGTLRACAATALANKGDASLREEMRRIIQNPDLLLEIDIRMNAARALGVIGKREDIEFLRDVSQNDPIESWIWGDSIYTTLNGKFVKWSEETVSPCVPPITDQSHTDKEMWLSIGGYPSKINVRTAARTALQELEKRYGVE